MDNTNTTGRDQMSQKGEFSYVLRKKDPSVSKHKLWTISFHGTLESAKKKKVETAKEEGVDLDMYVIFYKGKKVKIT